MSKLRTYGLLLLGLGSIALLTVGLRTRQGDSGTVVSLDDWDIPQFAAFLNERGLGLRLVSTMKGGDARYTAFLTTTDLEWENLNHLVKDAKRINEWRGTLYCERERGNDNWWLLTRHWGANYLIVGPFLLYGDPELLVLVRDAVETFTRANGGFLKRLG
jgi:hypothetical protein